MKKIISLLVFSTSVFSAWAQLNNTVEVTNEVKPVTTDVKKVDVKTQPAETKVKHYTMQYDVSGKTLSNYAPESLGDYESEAVWKGRKNGYLHLAGGVQGMLDGQAAYQLGLTDKDVLGFDLSLKGFNGHAKDNGFYDVRGWKSRDYTNRVALKYNHHFDQGVDFFMKGSSENRVFNYMGGNLGTTDKQHDVLSSFVAGFTPLKNGNFSVDATAGLDFFNQNYLTNFEKKLGETLIHADANGAYQFTDEHSVGLGVGFIHSAYGNDELKGITRFRFTPHYLYETEQMNVRLGLFVSTKGNVAPDASFTYHLTPKSDVYVEALGYEDNNDFRRMSAFHPAFALPGYISPDKSGVIKMGAEFHQLDACVGYRFKGMNGLGGDIHVGYDFSKDSYDVDGMFNALGGRYLAWMAAGKNRRFYMDADFTYAYADIVKVEARNQLNLESGKNSGDEKWVSGSYTSPVFEMDWKADVKIVKDFYFGLDWRYATFHMGDLGLEEGTQYDRPDIINLGASLRYTLPIKQPLTVFLKGDNLLNQKYDRYLGYRNVGATFLGGFALSF